MSSLKIWYCILCASSESHIIRTLLGPPCFQRHNQAHKQDLLDVVQEDPEWTAEKELCQRRGIPYVKPEVKKAAGEDEFAEEAELLEVGQRCECAPASRRGTIRCGSGLPMTVNCLNNILLRYIWEVWRLKPLSKGRCCQTCGV